MPQHLAPDSIHPVCEDLLLAILEEMPSRDLLQTRSVSRTFQLLADEVLRRRFLDIAEDSSKQLVLESCAPYEQRALHCQPLAFSHFAPPTDGLFTGNVAHFSVDALAQDAAEMRRLALDDGEMFQQNILPDAMDVDEASAPLPQSRFIDYNWTLDLATSLDRFFRSWFLESASEAISPRSSPCYSPSASPSISPSPSPSLSPSRSPSPLPSSRETRPRRLGPGSPPARSALLSASIACVQIPLSDVLPDGDEADVLCLSPGPSPPGSRFGSPAAAGAPRVYEYTFEDVALDVAKVVVLAEENLPPCGGGGRGPDGGRGVRVLAL